MAFSQKIIKVEITPGAGSFSPVDTQGLRTTFHCISVGAESMTEGDVIIYGLPLSVQNQISTLGQTGSSKNKDQITVYAGDTQNGLAMIYKGGIYAAFSDFQGGPNVPLHITSVSGQAQVGIKIPPTSINNKSADVAQMFSKLAGQMGLQFEDNGVKSKLAYPYFAGDAHAQMQQLARASNIHAVIDRGKLAIVPKGGNRKQFTATVSPTTGMVGYPSWSSVGIKLKVLYSPTQNWAVNGNVIVQGSSITPANGTWIIMRLEWSLQSNTPSGQWFVDITAKSNKK